MADKADKYHYLVRNIPNARQHYRLEDAGQGLYVREWNEAVLGAQPTDAELQAVDADVDEFLLKTRLSQYAEEKSLRHGTNMIDPNSSTLEAVADPTGGADEIRQATGIARAKMHNGKARGAEGVDSSVVGSKARNNAAQAVEESIGVELVNIELDIFTGAVTTEAEIDARISAIDLTY